MSDKKVVRPFFPGGDYQKDADSYDEHTVVIDNPPFSIISQIVKFYLERNILFFVFSPHLTVFSGRVVEHSAVITNVDIKYANGAKVRTSFLTNMIGDTVIKGSSTLAQRIKNAQQSEGKARSTFIYPKNVVTASSIGRLVEAGFDLEILRKDVLFIRSLDDQKKYGKVLYGAGFLVSDRVANFLSECKVEKPNYVWCISERERNLIDGLGEMEGY